MFHYNFFSLFCNLHFALNKATPPPFFLFLQCLTFTAVKKYRLCSNMASRETPFPQATHMLSLNTTEVVSTSRRKHWAGSLLGFVSHFNLSRGLARLMCPPSSGFHQVLCLASSNATRLKIPTAPSLFSRATLSLGMTT